MPKIERETIDFLKELNQHNNREWFQENKYKYELAHENMVGFASLLLMEMNKHDDIETPTGKKSLHRIYRDVRFSKDKTPYKNHFSGSFSRATELLRGGYYFHVEPGNSFAGGGFWGPSKEDLQLLREHIAQDDTPFRAVINSNAFKDTFGELEGETLKTAPKGFDKEHPAIDLLRFKSFLLRKDFTDQEVIAGDFHIKVNETFKAMRPFFDVMSECLTTNLNGELLKRL